MSSKDLGVSLLLDCYSSLLSDPQRECLEYYYNEDFSLGEISELMNMSRQGVLSNIKKGEAALHKYEANLQLCEKKRKFETASEQLTEILTSIKSSHPELDKEIQSAFLHINDMTW